MPAREEGGGGGVVDGCCQGLGLWHGTGAIRARFMLCLSVDSRHWHNCRTHRFPGRDRDEMRRNWFIIYEALRSSRCVLMLLSILFGGNHIIESIRSTLARKRARESIRLESSLNSQKSSKAHFVRSIFYSIECNWFRLSKVFALRTKSNVAGKQIPYTRATTITFARRERERNEATTQTCCLEEEERARGGWGFVGMKSNKMWFSEIQTRNIEFPLSLRSKLCCFRCVTTNAPIPECLTSTLSTPRDDRSSPRNDSIAQFPKNICIRAFRFAADYELPSSSAISSVRPLCAEVFRSISLQTLSSSNLTTRVKFVIKWSEIFSISSPSGRKARRGRRMHFLLRHNANKIQYLLLWCIWSTWRRLHDGGEVSVGRVHGFSLKVQWLQQLDFLPTFLTKSSVVSAVSNTSHRRRFIQLV